MGVEVEMLVAPVSSANSHRGTMEGSRTMPGQPLSLISAGTTSLRTVWQTVQVQRANERRLHLVGACSGNTSPRYWPRPLLSFLAAFCASLPYEAIELQISW